MKYKILLGKNKDNNNWYNFKLEHLLYLFIKVVYFHRKCTYYYYIVTLTAGVFRNIVCGPINWYICIMDLIKLPT